MASIYKITSIKTGNIYVGSAVNFVKRKHNHISDLRKQKHANSRLQNHVNKYGIEDLIFEILEETSAELLLIREQFYIDTLKPFFNICKIAGNSLGLKASYETRKKQSAAKKGKPGNRKGRKMTPEQLERHRLARIGQTPWNKGKKTDADVVDKLRKAHQGQRPSASNIAARNTPESLQKRANTMRATLAAKKAALCQPPI